MVALDATIHALFDQPHTFSAHLTDYPCHFRHLRSYEITVLLFAGESPGLQSGVEFC
jgi:hypothetical protein